MSRLYTLAGFLFFNSLYLPTWHCKIVKENNLIYLFLLGVKRFKANISTCILEEPIFFSTFRKHIICTVLVLVIIFLYEFCTLPALGLP